MAKCKKIDKKWKTQTCQQGAKCWCRIIVTENCTAKGELEECIAISGSLTKQMAQHFVSLHNEWLCKKHGGK